jgi:5-(carboxyamino)imidazole ribonucleotide synthase
MLALAGYPLGLRFRFFDPAPDSPAGQLAEHVVAEYDDWDALRRFAQGVDAITYEFENVPVETARFLTQFAPVYPPPQALEAAQDRLNEKTLFRRLGIPTPPFAPVDSRGQLDAAVRDLGLPAVLKTRRLGYDGKGQHVLRAPESVDAAWQALGGASLILEGFVPFEREVSVLAVRSRTGESAFYPLVENHHRDGILRLSLAPSTRAPLPAGEGRGLENTEAHSLSPWERAGVRANLHATACDYASRVTQHLDYVGVLAIEFFQHDGRLLANEMAPRVHNSGHWTIEGAETSQFENHLRAVLGWPLGSTASRGCSAMLNLIGALPEAQAVLALPNAHLHLYGKAPRPGRKLGHITLRAEDPESLYNLVEQARPIAEF